MIKLSNSSLIKIFSKLLILLVVAKIISLGVWWYLPSDGEELIVKSNYQPKYQRVDFKNMIQAPKIIVETKKEEVNPGISITNMILKGLYGKKTSGYVIIAMKSKPRDTSIIGIAEEYKGFTLKSITTSSAIFEKDSIDYILEILTDKEKSKQKASVKKRPQAISKMQSAQADQPRGVTRSDIEFFAKNPKQIWREISIVEVKDGKKIKGFKVTKIDRRSKFATLGLQRGDVIIKANNVKLESYRDAIQIYQNIGKLDTIQIVVIRNNQEKELVYEIN